jgi:primosomal protein N' (replication factor Y)
VESCPNCEIPLTYHGGHDTGELYCHHCNYQKKTETVCPKCSSSAIRYFGKGTERIEEEAKKLFPGCRVKRMDADSVKKDHYKFFNDFRNQEFDILVGTQMIAKGWDLPNVELVGIISVDGIQNLPDFRSEERVFNLVTQVAEEQVGEIAGERL